MRRFPLLFCLSLLAVPAHAQNGTGIFMGQDLVLRADPPIQLSLNAHVSQFLYQPTADHIAYVSVKDAGGTRTTSIQYVTTRHPDPETVMLQSVAGDTPDAATPTGEADAASLMNWSSDGRYLVFEIDSAADAQNTPEDSTNYYVADTAAQAFAVQVRQLPAFPTPEHFTGPSEAAWSPSQTRLLIFQEGVVPNAAGPSVSQDLGALYDPTSGQMHALQIPSGDNIIGWQDEGHLQLSNSDHPTGYLAYDVGTDAVATIPHGTPWPPVLQSLAYPSAPASATTPKAPGLTLETDPQLVSDPQGAARAPVYTVWLRRPAAPKPMSALAVAVVHDASRPPTPGPTFEDDSDPQPQWSPDGNAVAYLAHGDLFVAPLTEDPATPKEKIAAGEKLDCEEERQIILSNLKQIGLGLIEYTQDNDEKYPPASNWQNDVGPYLQDNSLFNFAGVPVIYVQPPGVTLASIDSPADLPLATADTPCAHLVLFADGHVKAFNRTGQ